MNRGKRREGKGRPIKILDYTTDDADVWSTVTGTESVQWTMVLGHMAVEVAVATTTDLHHVDEEATGDLVVGREVSDGVC